MNKLIVGLVFFVFLTGERAFSQEFIPINRLEKGKFFTDFSVAGQGRNFERGTFLGDAYRMSMGYRVAINIGISGYPGMGWYGGGQSATILENQFLGGFFDKARIRDGGIFIFHSIPVGKRFVIQPELGFGILRVIQGISPSRFILNYEHYFGKAGFQYPVIEISPDFILSLTLGASYGIYNGKNIVINDQDRNYIRRSSDFQIHSGILIKIH